MLTLITPAPVRSIYDTVQTNIGAHLEGLGVFHLSIN